jgi:hypothetical protein
VRAAADRASAAGRSPYERSALEDAHDVDASADGEGYAFASPGAGGAVAAAAAAGDAIDLSTTSFQPRVTVTKGLPSSHAIASISQPGTSRGLIRVAWSGRAPLSHLICCVVLPWAGVGRVLLSRGDKRWEPVVRRGAHCVDSRPRS